MSVLLGKIVREATGMRLDAWAEEKLFRPIGIDEYYWKITPDGEVDSEGGLYLAPHDLARIGYLMLRGGEWDGQRVLSEDWVRASTAPVIPDLAPDNDDFNGGYGYQWWVPVHENGEPIVFAANGYGGQFMHVAPEHDLIAVFNGWTLHEQPELSSWMAFQTRILPALTDIGDQDAEEAAVSRVLDALHQAASDADFERYFGLYADEFIFLGTDATERWDREQFMEYARAPFSQGRGWTYTMTERHVYIAPGGRTAWFDERLDNAGLGETRGSGALIKVGDDWKITQYNLTIPVPNELAGEFVARIREVTGGGG